MAVEETEVAEEVLETEDKSESKGVVASLAKATGIAIGLFAALLLSQALAPVLTCALMKGATPNCPEPPPEPEVQQVVEEEEIIDESEPPLYLALDPPLVVSFEDQSSIRFLQVTVQVMSRDDEIIEAVEAHMPVIRNNLLMLFGSQTVADLTNREAKEQLRKDTLAEVRKVLKQTTGRKKGLEEVYFTSFVVQ